MTYQKLNELPKGVQNNLPPHAQKIYKEAFNSAWEQYAQPSERENPEDTREETAHKVAWNAVKQTYHKTAEGTWVKSGH